MTHWNIISDGLIPITDEIDRFVQACEFPQITEIAGHLKYQSTRPSYKLSSGIYTRTRVNGFGSFSRKQLVTDILNRTGFAADSTQFEFRINKLLGDLKSWEDLAFKDLVWRESDISFKQFDSPSYIPTAYDLLGEELTVELLDISGDADETSRWLKTLIHTLRTSTQSAGMDNLVSDGSSFLDLKVDRIRGEVRRVGNRNVVCFRPESAELHTFIVAFDSGDVGATKQKWMNGYPGDTSRGKAQDAMRSVKKVVSGKLLVLGLRLKKGVPPTLEEVD